MALNRDVKKKDPPWAGLSIDWENERNFGISKIAKTRLLSLAQPARFSDFLFFPAAVFEPVGALTGLALPALMAAGLTPAA